MARRWRALAAAIPQPFNWLWVAVPIAAALILLGVDATDLDRIIESRFYDAPAGVFPLRHDPFLEVVLHYWTKYVVALIAGLAFAGFALSFMVATLEKHRRVLLFIGLSIALATATVTALKLASSRHCPWDLVDYGGLIPYTKLLQRAAPAAKPGHCFPAGHASTGFSLLVFYFVGLVRRNRWLSRAGLALGIAAGLVLGLGRMLQGAHFLTHVLWSGIVCWLVILGLYVAFYRFVATGRGQGRPPPEPALRSGGAAD